MVDFRYHLVSLISVFLALAVGIVLGAGPLRDTISDQLTGQVEQLRQEKDALRVELDASQREVGGLEAYAGATAERLLAGALPEHRVALVRMPGVQDALIAELGERVREAGGEIVADVTMSQQWADPGQAALRARAAGEVASLLAQDPPASGTDAEETAVLARGLAEALRGASDEDPRVSGTVAGELFTALSAGTDPLVTGEVTGPADLILVITAPGPETPTATDPDPSADAAAAASREGWATALVPLGEAAPAVIAGYIDLPTDVLPLVRESGTVTTTDDLGSEVGRIIAVLALAAEAAGDEPGAYGFGPGVDAIVPPVGIVEPPLVLQPTPSPEEDPAGTEEPSDGTGGPSGDVERPTDGPQEETADADADAADAAGSSEEAAA